MTSNFLKFSLLIFVFALPGKPENVAAQTTDTLKLTLPEAEKLFIKNNYQLIAQNYQTDQARAEIITAKLFDNPELNVETQLYNHLTKKFFQTNSTDGEYQASLSQLVKLAGKRNKNIQLAKTGVKLAEYQYFDLIRTLRFSLRSNFYKTYYAQQSAKLYQQQINSLQKLLTGSEQQLKMGNMAMKDIIRIKSLVYGLQTEYTNLENSIEDMETDLKLMTNIKADANLALVMDPAEEQSYQLDQTVYTSLLDSARTNRADLKLTQTGITYAEKALSVQKANAVPDVQFSLTYDLQGSYPNKYTGLGMHIPLPLFNRNQGEIKKAKIAIDAGKNLLNQQESTLQNEVFNSYKSALRTESLYKGFDKNFSSDFDKLIAEVIKNFKSRNLSLVEFMDFYDSYKESTLQMNDLKYQRMNAKEEINYVTGTTIFK
ncbi:cobalt-zinc-cadmium efflux system outer membrane protein [Pedobacter cryoconitis]|uniref:Cobalt-zinc-cadmium efflux system outer membrane protein n=1 Tax=Pedobacter cryoconitis TaxID=188932 RepID=A0A7W9E146_9SPHI|nr:TolC family protein [Pedobacter cryoconitis]MBB5639127.1 cobalt-zinc-cadmium efflux system outer membrane protein [Pedobacter cryoconitis]MBB6274899.1 cobalt-zinc-cadmium efflux system outer membrane protein [Pedobacter cryoconitis]